MLSSDDWILFLDDELSQQEAGGKAYRLNKVYDDFNVPYGFALSNTVFDTYVKDAVGRFEDELDSESCQDIDVYNISDVVQEEVEGVVDRDLVEAVDGALDGLQSDRFAVRSSAVSEDGSNHSYAGLLDSSLDVGREDVVEEVVDCWKSIFSTEVLAYAKSNSSLDDISGGMGVLVQEMIDPDVAGVAFSRNPSGGSGPVIEVVPGKGEKLVSGSATPNTYRFETGDPNQGSFQNNGSLQALNEPNEGIIDEGELEEVADLSLELERRFGHPQDVEWARDDEELYLLQTRPVTNL